LAFHLIDLGLHAIEDADQVDLDHTAESMVGVLFEGEQDALVARIVDGKIEPARVCEVELDQLLSWRR
jgi:hypothetical protein